jgi:riboflavin biosynthesis pyrimidine reductase
MKPHVILHMISSLDGRILTGDWPKDLAVNDIYERIHRDLGGDAWIVGSTTMGEFAKGESKPAKAEQAYPRETWKAPGIAKGPYAVGFDRQGKLHLNRNTANDDSLVMVLAKSVSDDHLAELRRDGISYIFAGDDDIDLDATLSTLAGEFGIKLLLLEGGGGINGAFLAAGLIDEISLLMLPLADGTRGVPSLFDRDGGSPARLELDSVKVLEQDILHMRYKVVR